MRPVFRAETQKQVRRVGRVAEGAPLLRAYRLTPIEGSNPSLSATNKKAPHSGAFLFASKSEFGENPTVRSIAPAIKTAAGCPEGVGFLA